MTRSKIDIVLFFGGPSAEHEISLLSARSIYNAFSKQKYNIYALAISEKGKFHSPTESHKILVSNQKNVPAVNRNSFLTAEIFKFIEKMDLVFPVLHGPYGEDGKLQGFLDILNKKYIGCGLLSSAVGMDKAVMKKIFSYHNLPQSDFMILKKSDYENSKNTDEKIFNNISENLDLPFFIKPANMGSSIGISCIHDLSEFKVGLKNAFKYDNKLVFESYIEAREIEAAVLGTSNNITVSAFGEIKSKHKFYNYEAKYEDNKTRLVIPAQLSTAVENKIKELSIKAFKSIDGEGISRLDFFVKKDKNKVLINEINTMPGFTEFSMYPLLFKEVGIKYPELLDRLVDIALASDR